MPSDNYAVDGNIDWMVKQSLVDVLQNSLDVADVFSDPTPNVRHEGDVSTPRDMPGIAVDALAQRTLVSVPEYRARVEVICESKAAVDTDTEQIGALLGIVRDTINADDFLDKLNDQGREIVFHRVDEIDTFEDDEATEKIRRRVIQLDAWCYPGRVTE